MRRTVEFLILFSLLLSGCEFPAPDQIASASGPRAWIDAPLSGTNHPLAPIELVAHGGAADGVTVIELSIDGNTVVEQGFTGNSLETLRFDWAPPGPGTYTFTARARSGTSWSSTSMVVFTVSGDAPPSNPDPTEPADGPADPTMTATPLVTPATETSTTLTPTSTPTAPPPSPTSDSGEVTATFVQNAFCRQGPGTQYPDVTAYEAGTTLRVTGINTARTWVQVAVPNSSARCWVSVISLQLGGNIESVPVLPDPPTPTPSPTAQLPTNTPVLTPSPTAQPPTNTPVPPSSTPVPPTAVPPTPTPTQTQDVQPPSVGISISPPNPVEGDQITFTSTASDNVGVVKIEIYIWTENNEQGLSQTCLNTTFCDYEGGPYAEGTIQFEARAYDAAGNMASTGILSVNVVPPP